MFNSIQKRLLVYILSITTIFLVAISAVNFYWARQQVSDLSQEKVAAMADAANARVEGYLLQKGQNAWTLAQNEQIHAFVKKVSSQPVELEDDRDYREMMTSFQRIVNLNQDIKFIYVGVAKTDRLYANTEFNYPQGYSVSVRPWYKAAAEKETLVFTAPYICPLTGRYVVTASAPFYDEQGNLLGVAAVDILVDRLQEIIEDIHIGDKGYAFMLDEKGVPIAAAQSQYFKKYIKDMDKNIPGIEQIKTKMLAGEKGITISSYQGAKSFIIYTPVSRVGWSIGAVVPANEVWQPIYGLGKFSLITVVLGMIVITLLIVMLTSRITKPINEFTGLMKRAEDGDFTVRARIESQDEIGRLGNSLNHMLEKQQELIRQVIIMANKMSASGYELAVTMGETKSTLPAATNELSMLLDKSYWEKEIDSSILGKTPGNQAFLEKLIACDHQCRLIQIQAEISRQSIQNLAGLNETSDCNAAIAVVKHDTELLMANLQDLSNITSTLLVDYTEIYNYLKAASRDLHDVKYTLSTVNRQINSIADIQIDATQRAIHTAGEVVKYAYTLINLTESFHIHTITNDEGMVISADNADTEGMKV
ncbi:MAG: methyl-accepting chemotaxis protein [Syntrophomonadaceae bacterium]|nr:methyl-accepting chemotaxis protein [Syntrophomonadaceae bacterium]